MVKVRFELNIDKIVEVSQFPNNREEFFNGEEAKGKTFLFIDKLTGDMEASVCIEPGSEKDKFANVASFFLPKNAIIINEEDKDEKHEAIMAHVQNCCDVIRKDMVYFQNEVSAYIGKEFDALKSEGISNGSGISEKTLLNALEIVTKNNK